jgi:hypothetical protein
MKKLGQQICPEVGLSVKWGVKSLAFVVVFATFQFLQIPSANAVTANTGTGITFTYSAGATNQQIALAACEAVNGTGSCRTGSCGYFFYYYKSTDLTCDCAKAIGTYEFVYNNTGYTSVGGDYAQSNQVNVSGNSRFVRKKNQSQCYLSDVWLLVNDNLGAALNVSSSITVSNLSGARFRSNSVITATASVPGKITFYANNKKIPGCIKVATNVSNVATCNWKPSIRGSQLLSAYLLPTDSSYLTSDSSKINVFVTNRNSQR